MSFFDLGSFRESNLSMEHFREWAGEIASSYLKGGAAPTETLCKIAQSEELSPHQIEVLAGEANKLIHTHKYASATDKYMAADFPLADARQAISTLAIGGETKVAAAMPDPVFDDELDVHKAFGIPPEGPMDKTASVKHQLKTASEKLAMLQEKLTDKIYLEKCAADEAERTFIKQARQMVLTGGYDSSSRMKVLGNLDHFVKCASMEFARPSLAKLAYVLSKEGMLLPNDASIAMGYFMSKEADCKAPASLISENLKAQVVNGTHPLYITLKTFQDHSTRMTGARERSYIVDDQLKILRQRVRAL
jgi:hypothetical protein